MKRGEHFVYILECRDKTYYTGYTNDIEKRLAAHEKGTGAKYTKGRGPFTLVYCSCFSLKQEALREEYRIKQLTKIQKHNLIKGKGGREDEHSEKL
ncbi:GIY-YIG nuclease family protein [Alteribacter natronophilus]|uniref:GIY-YIG nuclease family protein n=1 Tax=Alteribacter natronophilus TaxID=2583810 RepID=UPI00110F4824|nr:GIY-YIG nuclease family protein [Alteribacter natronophilus]TMW69971.1 GIY-YIG nuclease family protein [Alteribacter natronophilus]